MLITLPYTAVSRGTTPAADDAEGPQPRPADETDRGAVEPAAQRVVDEVVRIAGRPAAQVVGIRAGVPAERVEEDERGDGQGREQEAVGDEGPAHTSRP